MGCERGAGRRAEREIACRNIGLQRGRFRPTIGLKAVGIRDWEPVDEVDPAAPGDFISQLLRADGCGGAKAKLVHEAP